MTAIDQLARAGTIALLALMGVVLLRDRRRSVDSWAACALAVSMAAHLVISSPDYRHWTTVHPFLQGAALVAPAVFWFFARAFFGDENRLSSWNAAAAVTLITVGFGRPAPVADAIYYAASVGLVGLALTQVMRGLRVDLVEPRRRIRTMFVVVVGVEILVVLGVEVWLAGAPASRELELVKSVAALMLTLAFCAWLFVPRPDLMTATTAATRTGPEPSAAPDADARFRERLLVTMRDEQLYKQEGLTIGALAQTLDVPEYRVRRIINQQLGHRNFNAFLNELRIAEACRILTDPADERLPIFNLALDLGYGSLGPFNRAFRSKTGQTPTEYRRTHLRPPAPTRESPAES